MNHRDYFKKNKVKLTPREELIIKIGGIIIGLRLKHCLTQGQLAKKIGTKQPAIARIENGELLPSLEVLQKIASKTSPIIIELK